MFRKYLKPSLYLCILLVPFFFVFIKPKSVKPGAILDKASVPVGFVQNYVQELKKFWYYRDTYDQYVRMSKQTDLLKAKVVRLSEDLLQAQRAAKIAEFRRTQNFSSVVANVIGRDPSSWNASLILDKGTKHGLKVGMPVVSPLGVVGKIMEVGSTTSKAVLVADPNFSVAAVVVRSRESGLLTGTLQGVCRLQYLTEDADVKVGDQVLTSKLSSAFPEGLLIGSIVDVQASQNSHTAECLVEPAVDLSQLEEVMVIKNNERH